MLIQKIELFHIRLPLKTPFKTAKAALHFRETLIIKVTDEQKNTGYGEVVAFKEPFYTGETLAQAKGALVTTYIPQLSRKEVVHPFDIHDRLSPLYPMAAAGLENALLDLYGRANQKSVMKVVFDEETSSDIFSGIVLGDGSIHQLTSDIGRYLAEGYGRFKIKIRPEDGFSKLCAIREKYPDIPLLADANRSYQINQLEAIRALDVFQLLCLEEPLDCADFRVFRDLQKEMATPICLDESIQTMDQLKAAAALGAFQVLNIKIGRVGGLYYAKKMIQFCRENGIRYWVGSMLESGVSKILHVHLASLKDTYIPGDLSPSQRYFENDIIHPEISAQNGKIHVPQGFGLGVAIDEDALKRYTVDYFPAAKSA
ncbi:MAG: o-succinylbenzoate synthase [Burkholderiales bacterium]|jgi:O-succinylbenzoate synthase|nr:o-succinylbenzoate synthase [Burkholderiales bacterium]